jgi:hypothetical protein
MLFGDRIDKVDNGCDSEESKRPVHKISPRNGRLDVDPYQVSDSPLNNIKNPECNVVGQPKNNVNDGKEKLD